MKNFLFFFILIAFTACNNTSTNDDVVTTDSVAETKTDSSANYIYTFSDTALANKITTELLKLPFVIKSNNYIDSFSNHKHGIVFMLEHPAANETDIPVQAGYNGDQRFETYYRFFVNPKTLEIKVYDPVAGNSLSVKDYLKTQK
ncbi:MAG: hypothetical protein WBP16_05675 [Ferruginibacter sp.]